MENVEITALTAADAACADRMGELLGQLASRPVAFTADDVRAMAADGGSRVFLLRVRGRLAGMLTVGTYFSPTGRKAWIEDVVVAEEYRGRSFGRLLVEHAVEYVRGMAPAVLMLTSRPSREAANALYRSAGFERKDTNVYRMDITE